MPVAKWDPKTSWQDSSNDINVRRSQRGVGGRTLQGRDSRGIHTPEEVDRKLGVMEYWQGQREHDQQRMAHSSSSNAGPSRQPRQGHRSTSDPKEGKTNQSPYAFGKNTLKDAAEKRKRDFARKTAGAGVEAVNIDDEPPIEVDRSVPEKRFYNTRHPPRASHSRSQSPVKPDRHAVNSSRQHLRPAHRDLRHLNGGSLSPEKTAYEELEEHGYTTIDRDHEDQHRTPAGPSKPRTRAEAHREVIEFDDADPDPETVAGPSEQTPSSGSSGRSKPNLTSRIFTQAMKVTGLWSPTSDASHKPKGKGREEPPTAQSRKRRKTPEEREEPIEDRGEIQAVRTVQSKRNVLGGLAARIVDPAPHGKGKGRAKPQETDDSEIEHVEQPRGHPKGPLNSRIGNPSIPSSNLPSATTRGTTKIASAWIDGYHQLPTMQKLVVDERSMTMRGPGHDFIRIRFEEFRPVRICYHPEHPLVVAQLNLLDPLSGGARHNFAEFCKPVASRGRPNFDGPMLWIQMAPGGHNTMLELFTHVTEFQSVNRDLKVYPIDSLEECEAAKIPPSKGKQRNGHRLRDHEEDEDREARLQAAENRAKKERAKGTSSRPRTSDTDPERKRIIRPKDANQPTLNFQRSYRRQREIDNDEYGGEGSTSMPGAFQPTRRSNRSHPQKSTGMFVGMDSEDDGDVPVPASRPEAPPPRVKPPTDKNEFLFSYPEGTGSIAITAGDLYRIESLDFLNDTLIEFGLRHAIIAWKIEQEEQERRAKEKGEEYVEPLVKADDVHLFNSFFYEKLSTKGTMKYNPETESWPAYESVKKWTRNKHIFDKKLILVPINENMHWYLAVIYRPSGVLRKVDPEPEAEGDEGGPATATRSKDAKDQGSEGRVESMVDPVESKASTPLTDAPSAEGETAAAPPEEEAKEEKEASQEPAMFPLSPASDKLSSATPETKRRGHPLPADENGDGELHEGDTTIDPLDVMAEDVKQMETEDVADVRQHMNDVTMDDPSADEAEATNAPLQTMTMLAVKHQDGASASRPTTPLPTGVQNATAVQESPTGRSKRVSPGVQILNGEECWIFTFDSLGGAHKPANEILGRWLQFEARDKRQFEGAIQKPSYREARVPQQPNFSDCGLFLVHYARQLMERTKDILKQIEEGVPFTGNPARHDFDFRVNTTWKNEETRDLRTTWESLILGLSPEDFQTRHRERGLPSRPNPPGESAANGANPLAAEQSTDDIQLLSQDPRKSEGVELPPGEQEGGGDVVMPEDDQHGVAMEGQPVDEADIDPALLRAAVAPRKTRTRGKQPREDDTHTIGSSSEDEPPEPIEGEKVEPIVESIVESVEEMEGIEQFSDPLPAGLEAVGMAQERRGSRSKSKEGKGGSSREDAVNIDSDDDVAVPTTPAPAATLEKEPVVSPKAKGKHRQPLAEIPPTLSSPQPENISADNLTGEDDTDHLSPRTTRKLIMPTTSLLGNHYDDDEDDVQPTTELSPVKPIHSPFHSLAIRGPMSEADKQKLSQAWDSPNSRGRSSRASAALPPEPSPSIALRSGAGLAGRSTGEFGPIDWEDDSPTVPTPGPTVSETAGEQSDPEDLPLHLGARRSPGLDEYGAVAAASPGTNPTKRSRRHQEDFGSRSPEAGTTHGPPSPSRADEEVDELSSSSPHHSGAAFEVEADEQADARRLEHAGHTPQRPKPKPIVIKGYKGRKYRNDMLGHAAGGVGEEHDTEMEELAPAGASASAGPSKRAGSHTSPVQPAKKTKRGASGGTPAGHKILDERGDSLNPIELEDSDEDK